MHQCPRCDFGAILKAAMTERQNGGTMEKKPNPKRRKDGKSPEILKHGGKL